MQNIFRQVVEPVSSIGIESTMVKEFDFFISRILI